MLGGQKMKEYEERQFLIQFEVEDEEGYINKIATSAEVISFIDELDFTPIGNWYVFDLNEFGKVKQLHYKGWQPNCLIELVDDTGEIIISGYGTDH